MHIAVLSFYSGVADRGVETVVSELATHWSKRHHVRVYQSAQPKQETTYSPCVIPPNLRTQHILRSEILSTHWLRKLHLDPHSRAVATFTARALKHMGRGKADIILATNGGWQTLFAKRYCLRNKCKLVISGQAGLGWDERWNLYLKPDLFIATSKRNQDWVQARFPKQPQVLIPNGVDLQKFSIHRSTSPENTTIVKPIPSLPKPVILCVAGPEKYKRVEATIKAVAKLKKGNLVVVGGSETTQQLGAQYLKKRFEQLTITHSQMPAVYQRAAVFTLCSQSTEAFGISYLEALASNLPVVATDDELRREIVGEAGVYVSDPTNAVEYAQKLQFALDASWGTIPRQRSQAFSWDIIAFAYEQAFHHLLAP